MSMEQPSDKHGLAPPAFAIVIVFLVTVWPWLMAMMFKQAISDFRRWRSKAARVDAGRLQLRGDGITGSRIARDRGARVIE